MIVPAYPGRIVPLEIFTALKFGMGFFGGVEFWSRDFFGVLISASIQSSLSLEI